VNTGLEDICDDAGKWQDPAMQAEALQNITLYNFGNIKAYAQVQVNKRRSKCTLAAHPPFQALELA
jgi:hypothetical protein